MGAVMNQNMKTKGKKPIDISIPTLHNGIIKEYKNWRTFIEDAVDQKRGFFVLALATNATQIGIGCTSSTQHS